MAGSNLNWAKSFPSAAEPNLTILLSIFKFDRMEWAIEKCVELGASRIVPWLLIAPRAILPRQRQSVSSAGSGSHCRRQSSRGERQRRKSRSRWPFRQQ